MVNVKMMDQEMFDKFVKEMNALGELIKARQDEKQAIVDEFDKEKGRYSKGNISKATLMSSVKKTNAELVKLDKQIRTIMVNTKKSLSRMTVFVRKQRPKVFRAKESGVSMVSAGASKKRSKVKKVVDKKAVKKTVSKKVKGDSKLTASEIKAEMMAEKKFRK